MSIPTEWLPKTFRPVVLTILTLASVAVATVAIGAWVDGRADARIEVRVAPLAVSVQGIDERLESIDGKVDSIDGKVNRLLGERGAKGGAAQGTKSAAAAAR